MQVLPAVVAVAHKAVTTLLGGTGIDVEEYKAKSGGDETAIQNMLEMRVFQFVIDNANIVDVETPADEILKLPEE